LNVAIDAPSSKKRVGLKKNYEMLSRALPNLGPYINKNVENKVKDILSKNIAILKYYSSLLKKMKT
jgi:hypothetical protein